MNLTSAGIALILLFALTLGVLFRGYTQTSEKSLYKRNIGVTLLMGAAVFVLFMNTGSQDNSPTAVEIRVKH